MTATTDDRTRACRRAADLALVAWLVVCGASACDGEEDARIMPCEDDPDGYGCLVPKAGPRFADTVAVNTHYAGPMAANDPEALALLAAAGVSIVRNDLVWSSIETVAGEYDFETNGYDEFVETAENAGLRILFILDYGNALYGPEMAVVDDAGRTAFAAFARAAAERYGGRGHLFEIWNEPNLSFFWSSRSTGPDSRAYGALVDAAVPVLREADPDAQILIGAVAMTPEDILAILANEPPIDFIDGFLEAIHTRDATAISLHLYRSEPPETASAEVSSVRELLASHDLDLDVWCGEWGYSTYDPNGGGGGFDFIDAVTPDEHASVVTRMFLSDYLLGLGGTVYFKDRNEHDAHPGRLEENWGLLEENLTPKPAYDALATLSHLVGSYEGVGSLRLDADEYGVVFAGPGETVTALWSSEDRTWRLRPTSNAGGHVLGRNGEAVAIEGLERGDDGSLAVAASEGPIYLIGDLRPVAATR